MGFKVKLGLLVAILAVTVGLLVAATATTQEAERVYTIAMHEDMTTTSYINYLGPGASVWNAYVLGNMHAGLYTLADVTFKPILGLAEDYATPVVKEGDFWTSEVCLTPGNLWTDGTEITVEDVAFTYNTVLEMDPVAMGGNWPAIFNPDYLDRVEITTDNCIKFFLIEKPGLPVWEYGLLGAPILQEAFWGPKFENALASADPIATIMADPGQPEPSASSFEFVQWEPGAFAEIERSDVTAPMETEGLSRLVECESGFYGSAGVGPVAGGGFNGSIYFVAANDGEYSVLKGIEGDLAGTTYTYNDANRAVSAYTAPSSDINALWDFANGLLERVKGEIACATTLDFNPGPYIDAVLYKLFGTLSSAALALIAGEVDFQLNPLSFELGLRRQLKAAENVEVFTNPDNGFYYLSWNLRRPPMNNLYFRKAIDCVIDREYVTQQLLQGVAFAGYSPIPPGNAFWYKPPTPEQKDARCIGFTEAEKVARAVEYLKQGGFTWQVEPQVTEDGQVIPGKGIMLNGELVPEVELIHPNAAYDNRRNIFGLHVARRANTLGIPLRSVPTGFNVIVSRVFTEQDFDMWELGWSLGIYPDHLFYFFHSSMAEPGGFNPEGYMNPEFDALAEAFLAEQDLTAAQEQIYAMQDFLSDELPYAVLFYAPVYEAYRTDKVEYPYLETLAGLNYVNGMPGYVKLLE